MGNVRVHIGESPGNTSTASSRKRVPERVLASNQRTKQTRRVMRRLNVGQGSDSYVREFMRTLITSVMGQRDERERRDTILPQRDGKTTERGKDSNKKDNVENSVGRQSNNYIISERNN